MVAMAVAALDQMFFLVPARLGTLEGARVLVLSAVGIPQVFGLTFGLIARLESLFWNGIGLLTLCPVHPPDFSCPVLYDLSQLLPRLCHPL